MQEFDKEEMVKRLFEILKKHNPRLRSEKIAREMIDEGVFVSPVKMGEKRNDGFTEEFISCMDFKVCEDSEGNIRYFGEIHYENEDDRGKTIVTVRCIPWYEKKEESKDADR